jgi:hypothetical protein
MLLAIARSRFVIAKGFIPDKRFVIIKGLS